MKLAVFSATSAAVLLSSVSALATAETHELPDSLPSDNSLSLKLKNYYQDRQFKGVERRDTKVTPHDKLKAWGQGLEINFESGYFGNETAAIGFDFSLYGGLKLIGKDSQFGTHILKEDEVEFNAKKGLYEAEQSSIGKIGLAHVKAFVGDTDYNVLARAGLIQINKPLLNGSSKLLNTSFQGASADAKLGDIDVYGAWTNKVMVHNSDKMEDFTSSKPGKDGRYKDNTKVDNIYTLGGSYVHESGIGAGLDYAASSDYLKMYRANLHYTFPIDQDTTLFLEGEYYKAKENGDSWASNGTTYGGFDKDAKLYVLNAILTHDMVTASLSYSKVDAEKDGALGVFDYNLATDSKRTFNDIDYATKRQISDFNHNGEKVLQASLGYSFEKLGAPGLNASYTYTKGSDIKASHVKNFDGKYKENEHNLAISYAFQQKELEGLNVTLKYAQHDGDKELSQINNRDKKGFAYDKTTDLRFIVDYSISVF